MPKYDLFFDLDQTTVDLSAEILKHYNHDFKDNKTKITDYHFKDLNKATLLYFNQLFNTKGLFYNAPPMEDAIEIINKFLEKGYECYFLSSPLQNQYCAWEKYAYIHSYLPNFKKDNIIFAGNKSILSNKNRILLDDHLDYLLGWENNEGIGIAFAQPWNVKYDGYRVKSWKEFYELIIDMEEN